MESPKCQHLLLIKIKLNWNWNQKKKQRSKNLQKRVCSTLSSSTSLGIVKSQPFMELLTWLTEADISSKGVVYTCKQRLFTKQILVCLPKVLKHNFWCYWYLQVSLVDHCSPKRCCVLCHDNANCTKMERFSYLCDNSGY